MGSTCQQSAVILDCALVGVQHTCRMTASPLPQTPTAMPVTAPYTTGSRNITCRWQPHSFTPTGPTPCGRLPHRPHLPGRRSTALTAGSTTVCCRVAVDADALAGRGAAAAAAVSRAAFLLTVHSSTPRACHPNRSCVLSCSALPWPAFRRLCASLHPQQRDSRWEPMPVEELSKPAYTAATAAASCSSQQAACASSCLAYFCCCRRRPACL